jgi:hypothetical protein
MTHIVKDNEVVQRDNNHKQSLVQQRVTQFQNVAPERPQIDFDSFKRQSVHNKAQETQHT